MIITTPAELRTAMEGFITFTMCGANNHSASVEPVDANTYMASYGRWRVNVGSEWYRVRDSASVDAFWPILISSLGTPIEITSGRSGPLQIMAQLYTLKQEYYDLRYAIGAALNIGDGEVAAVARVRLAAVEAAIVPLTEVMGAYTAIPMGV
jgi:hypothetical protein